MNDKEAWRDILCRAAQIIEDRGVCFGRRESWDGRVCSEGAIAMAATGNANSFAWMNVIHKEALDRFGEHVGANQAVWMWHDWEFGGGIFSRRTWMRGRTSRRLAKLMREAACA